MPDELPYEKILQESLKGELRVLNAHLPSQQKTLSALLLEDTPVVACSDGSAHLFKRKELDYLAGILESDEQEALLLPILIEVDPGQDEISVVCRSDVEEKVVSKILDMPLNIKEHRIKIYKPQLAVIRKLLKTTTQYLFSPKVLQ
ncbi:DUF61 family protein [Chloroflexota bacterium]